jgi:hypothetical protein
VRVGVDRELGGMPAREHVRQRAAQPQLAPRRQRVADDEHGDDDGERHRDVTRYEQGEERDGEQHHGRARRRAHRGTGTARSAASTALSTV